MTRLDQWVTVARTLRAMQRETPTSPPDDPKDFSRYLAGLLQELPRELAGALGAADTDAVVMALAVLADEEIRCRLYPETPHLWPGIQVHLFHRECCGDLFCDMLEKRLAAPPVEDGLFVIQVACFCLRSGYRGRWAEDDKGRDDLQHKVHRWLEEGMKQIDETP
ncbi:DotU family type IV/VI secretion system protein [Desulfoluna spongiiphila]|uniref:Type VI secretion system protein DotU n=1 Tax=Desulfoluna spongiiphila TaxID=419481 RepID=A0A1G5FK34_9BACT|nr:DotU family type IV/VI secretion system protein [Desulfoluna spongiiphila]SCY39210.1 Type VI secretion system protein DotU [Desulfoluna spongiiphila]VVS95576.1 type iv / vi secretion system dotu [Desulfoluna spongiiphila]